MTTTQHLILSLGMVVFSLTGLMPPWMHVRVDDPSTRVAAGSAFITVGAPVRPDEPGDAARPRRRGMPTYRGAPLRQWESRIDGRRLALRWGAVAGLTAAGMWLTAPGRRRTDAAV